MLERTRKLWGQQDRHGGDRQRLFSSVADAVQASRVLYPGCFCDLAPSFVWPSITYVDVDRRAGQFFADHEGIRELLEGHGADPENAVRFLQADYCDPLDLEEASFDLLVSLYAGFVSERCTRYLAVGGHLLANPSHGDVAMASIDPRYRLAGVVKSRGGRYSVTRKDLDTYLVPKRDVEVTRTALHESGRGIDYTRSPFAYLFERIS